MIGLVSLLSLASPPIVDEITANPEQLPERIGTLWGDMKFVEPAQSKKTVVAAGKVLAGTGLAYSPEVVDAFAVAHNWRDAYAYPMHRVRAQLLGKIKKERAGAITAARLKRMASIRRKLQHTDLTLYQMQDIGGARAIFPTASGMQAVLARYLDESGQALVRDNDYLAAPKADGYRSRHLVLKFRDPDGNPAWDRQFIEVQFRTALQHSWSTAIEAVGLVRNENLKAGEGSAEWLRLFAIMSSIFAEEEGTEPVPGVPVDPIQRRSELMHLERSLNAVECLRRYNEAINFSQIHVGHKSAPYYLLSYGADWSITVVPFGAQHAGSLRYQEAEQSGRNAVLVEVERVADLRQAFPNYFLDVGVFHGRLQEAIRTGNPPTPASPIIRAVVDWWNGRN